MISEMSRSARGAPCRLKMQVATARTTVIMPTTRPICRNGESPMSMREAPCSRKWFPWPRRSPKRSRRSSAPRTSPRESPGRRSKRRSSGPCRKRIVFICIEIRASTLQSGGRVLPMRFTATDRGRFIPMAEAAAPSTWTTMLPCGLPWSWICPPFSLYLLPSTEKLQI